MRRMRAGRPGRAIGYLLIGLLGGVLGGMVTSWMLGRQSGHVLTQSDRQAAGQVQQGVPSGVGGGTTVVEATRRVAPAVVNINTLVGPPPGQEGGMPNALRRLFPTQEERQPMPAEGRGSGVIINGREGYVLTNNHVVANANNITVFLPDKRSFQATVVGTDPYGDIALLKLSGASNLPEAKLGNSDDLPIGSTAIAIGNPFGIGSTVTVGVISAVNRELPAPSTGVPLENLIQTDAAINPGNSGGPLCDLTGSVIGMNTAIIPYGQGIGFAVAVNSIKHSVDDILKHGRAIRPWIGIRYMEIVPEIARQLGVPDTHGIVIRSVVPQGPADRAGIREGDVLTAVGSQKIQEQNDLPRTVRAAQVGDTLKITGFRGNRALEFQVRLGEMPPPEQLPRQ
jgi:serine protease Do